MSCRARIDRLATTLDGLTNDARYWDLRRTYGDYSAEVLAHLDSCARIQASRSGRVQS